MNTPALSAFASAILLSLALPVSAAYVRGELVWKCDFTPEEAARYGVAGRSLDATGRGAEYDTRGGASGDGALRFRSPAQDYEVKVSVQPDAPLAGMLLVEADVRGIGIGDGANFDTLRQLLPAHPGPVKLKGLCFKEFFSWLTDSLKSVSASAVAEQDNIRLGNVDSWADLSTNS
jgi:hypothetical protein